MGIGMECISIFPDIFGKDSGRRVASGDALLVVS